MSQPAHSKTKRPAINVAQVIQGAQLWQQALILQDSELLEAARCMYEKAIKTVRERVGIWGAGNNLRVEIGLHLSRRPISREVGPTLRSLASEAAIEASVRFRSLDLSTFRCVPWNDVRHLLDAFYAELGREADAALRAGPDTVRVQDAADMWKPLAVWSFVEGDPFTSEAIRLRARHRSTLAVMKAGGLPFLDPRIRRALRGIEARVPTDTTEMRVEALLSALTDSRMQGDRRLTLTQKAAQILAPMVRGWMGNVPWSVWHRRRGGFLFWVNVSNFKTDRPPFSPCLRAGAGRHSLAPLQWAHPGAHTGAPRLRVSPGLPENVQDLLTVPPTPGPRGGLRR